MEEKNTKQEERQQKKLSYEELEMAAKQMAAQGEAIVKENNKLKEALQSMSMSNVYTELEFRFKVLEHPEAFSTRFYDACVAQIEEIMTPKEKETNEGQED